MKFSKTLIATTDTVGTVNGVAYCWLLSRRTLTIMRFVFRRELKEVAAILAFR